MTTYFPSAPTIVSSDRVLYTASSFARSSLLHLQEIVELTAQRSHTSERSGLQSFLFFMVTSGSGKLVYANQEYELFPNYCVFINCMKPYSHTTNESDLWHLSWCHFYGPTLSSIYRKYCGRGGRSVFVPSDSAPFYNILSELLRVAKGSDYMCDMLINEQLSTLIRLIMEQSWHPEDKVLPSKRASVLQIKFIRKNTLKSVGNIHQFSVYCCDISYGNPFGTGIADFGILRCFFYKEYAIPVTTVDVDPFYLRDRDYFVFVCRHNYLLESREFSIYEVTPIKLIA